MSMREDLRIPLTMLSISFLNELPFSGSYNGKRFRFEKVTSKNDDNSDKLLVYVWKDVFNFENTDKKDIIEKEFEYTSDGIEKGLNFVEETTV